MKSILDCVIVGGAHDDLSTSRLCMLCNEMAAPDEEIQHDEDCTYGELVEWDQDCRAVCDYNQKLELAVRNVYAMINRIRVSKADGGMSLRSLEHIARFCTDAMPELANPNILRAWGMDEADEFMERKPNESVGEK